MEVAGEDGFGDFLGHTQVESIDAAAGGEIDSSKKIAAGMDLDDSLSAADVEKLIDQPNRFEYLEGAGMNHRGAVPVEGRGPSVNHMTLHAAAMKLRSQEKSSGTGTDHKHGNPLGSGVEIVRPRQTFGMIGEIRHGALYI